MTLRVPMTHPASDARFRTLVQSGVGDTTWEMTSPEGIALLEALLRTRYPYAAVIARAQTALDALHELDPLVVAYRDGLPDEAEVATLPGDGRPDVDDRRSAETPATPPAARAASPVPPALAAWRAGAGALAALSGDDPRYDSAAADVDRLRRAFHAALATVTEEDLHAPPPVRRTPQSDPPPSDPPPSRQLPRRGHQARRILAFARHATHVLMGTGFVG